LQSRILKKEIDYFYASIFIAGSMNNRGEEIGTHYMQRNSISIRKLLQYFKQTHKELNLISIDRTLKLLN